MTEITDNTDRRRIAIVGGTGFVGSALARTLLNDGHQVVLVARRARADLPAGAQLVPIGLSDPSALSHAFEGCNAVAHLAGINRERGSQTYQHIDIEGTANVVAAARDARVGRIAMLSFLRARPDCGSPYHESKWQAEQIVRESGIPYTILKSGVIWGRGDHLLDHISHTLFTIPLFATVGWRQPRLRPIALRDIARILYASLIEGRLTNQTVAVVGPEELSMDEIVRRVARVCGRRALLFPMPVAFHRLLAAVTEMIMDVPLVSKAQVRMLTEGLCDPACDCNALSDDLRPTTLFTDDQIRHGLPPPGPFRRKHLSFGSGS